MCKKSPEWFREVLLELVPYSSLFLRDLNVFSKTREMKKALADSALLPTFCAIFMLHVLLESHLSFLETWQIALRNIF